MKSFQRGDEMPRLGEHVTIGGVRCLVIGTDDETATLLPLEELPETASAAIREAFRTQNNWWRRSPQCREMPKGSLYDGEGNLRPIDDVLSEIAELRGRKE